MDFDDLTRHIAGDLPRRKIMKMGIAAFASMFIPKAVAQPCNGPIAKNGDCCGFPDPGLDKWDYCCTYPHVLDPNLNCCDPSLLDRFDYCCTGPRELDKRRACCLPEERDQFGFCQPTLGN